MAQTKDHGQVPILIVEDQHTMRKAIRRTLERDESFRIEEFVNANEAIAFLKKNPVDLVISDIYMSNGDGFDLLRFVRNRPIANDIPVVFVSGEATKDDIVHAADLGVTDYILKPFEPQELQAKIKSVLERYQNPPERIQMLRTAESWLLLGDLMQAESLFQDLYAIDSKSPRVLVGLAQVELQKNNKEAALTYINNAISLNGMYFPAYALGANIYMELGNRADAIDLLLRELSINGKQTERRIQLAELYAEMEDMPNAFAQLRQSLLDNPKDERILLRMAEFYAYSGDAEKSIHYFLKTRRTHPKSMRALEGVSRVALHVGKPIKAIHAFTDLLKLNPNQKDIYLARAKLYEKCDDFENAMTDAESYIAAVPENIEGWQLKARLLTKTNRAPEAIEVWRKIVALSPTADAMGKLALLLLKQSDFAGAAALYERAIAIGADNAKFYFNLACAYESMNLLTKAFQAYERFLEFTPGNPDAIEALARIKQATQPQSSAPRPVAPSAPAPQSGTNSNESRARSLERRKPPRAS